MCALTAGKCSIHNVDQIGTVPAALTAYLALQVSAQWPHCVMHKQFSHYGDAPPAMSKAHLASFSAK